MYIVYDENCDFHRPSLKEVCTLYKNHVDDDGTIVLELFENGIKAMYLDKEVFVPFCDRSRNETAKYAVYSVLAASTGISLPWGDLTGVKPLKKMTTLLNEGRTMQESRNILKKLHDVSDSKLSLLEEAAKIQRPYLENNAKNASLYVHIPMCVSKCSYCSFPSEITEIGSELCEGYLKALIYELSVMKEYIVSHGYHIDTVYIGGGTPSVLSCMQIEKLLSSVGQIAPDAVEVSFEAGRSDTVDKEKMKILKDAGVNRISLNPQTMCNETLRSINRGATAEEFLSGFEIARETGFKNINCDLIFGLPGENPEIYEQSLSRILSLKPENITLHTLCKKRTSDIDESTVLETDIDIAAFQDYAREIMHKNNYNAYYLYRQKYAVSGAENIGYCRDNTPCIYNIRMMSETGRIFSAGANSTTKIFYKNNVDYENVYTVKDLSLYVSTIEDIVRKKIARMEEIEKK